ncbi:hypothetical protein J6590_035127 [Homalodisca vitripennis]|nr:hypothetical protein J6590_035127 [Homalodisca vitripennis]
MTLRSRTTDTSTGSGSSGTQVPMMIPMSDFGDIAPANTTSPGHNPIVPTQFPTLHLSHTIVHTHTRTSNTSARVYVCACGESALAHAALDVHTQVRPDSDLHHIYGELTKYTFNYISLCQKLMTTVYTHISIMSYVLVVLANAVFDRERNIVCRGRDKIRGHQLRKTVVSYTDTAVGTDETQRPKATRTKTAD